MKRITPGVQLGFSFEDEPSPDRLAERIITAGLAPNEYILSLNRGLTNPHVLPLPSRLYQFPIEFVEAHRLSEIVPDAQRLLLRHPALDQLPFVLEAAEKVGVVPTWEPPARSRQEAF
jgi:hypothetical protein